MDVMQKTTFKANTVLAIKQIEQEASLDPNMNNYDTYAKKLDSLKETHLKGFNNKMVEQESAMELDYDTNMSKIGIDNVFKKKQLDAGRASAKTLINVEQENYINAIDEKGRSESAFKIKKIIDGQVEKGIFGAEEGQELYIGSIKGANAAIRQQEEDIKRIKTHDKVVNRFNYIGQIANGIINSQNVNQIIRDIAITDPDLAEGIKKVFDSPESYIVNEFDNQAFQDIAKDIFLASDSKSVSGFLLNALKDNTNISKDRLAILVDAANERAKELPLEVSKKQKSSKPSFWKNALNIIATTSPLGYAFVLMNTIKRIKAEAAQGEQIVDIATDETRKQRIKDNTEISRTSKNGSLCKDKYGNKAIVYPDGIFEEVQSATGDFIHKQQRKKE